MEPVPDRPLLTGRVWLGVLFGAGAVELTELVARSRDIAAQQVRTVQILRLDPAGGPGGVLRRLLAPQDAALATSWVVDDGGSTPDREGLWIELLRRLNERRDVLRGRHPAALLLACPPRSLPMVRDEAPDLWSFRTFTATFDHQPVGSVAERPTPARVEPGCNPFGPVFGEPVRPSAATARLLRRAAGGVRSGRLDEALRSATAALSTSAADTDRVLAHAWLAQALAADDEPVEAVRHAVIALRARRPLEEATTVALLEILIGSAGGDDALDAASALVEVRRELVGRYDQSPTSLRDLSISLDKVADVHQARGDLDTALTGYTESLDLRRRLHTTYGDTPQALRDLSISLDKVARVQQARGHPDHALALSREALAIDAQLRDGFGSPFWEPAVAEDLRQRIDLLSARIAP